MKGKRDQRIGSKLVEEVDMGMIYSIIYYSLYRDEDPDGGGHYICGDVDERIITAQEA